MFRSLWSKVRTFLRKRSISDSVGWVPYNPDYSYHPPDPWYVSAYWAVYRFFRHSNFSNPRGIYREIKWFIQRGRRGWADRDTWSLDYYLNSWMPDALRHLKNTKHGIPSSMFTEDDCQKEGKWAGNPSEDGEARAAARWDAIMDKMIAGFEASRRINDGLYEEELGKYPLYSPAGVSQIAWKKVHDDHFEASKLLAARDVEIMKEGLGLFIEHYTSLWD